MKEIHKIINCVSGNVLAIGVDNKIIKKLEQNDRIENCNLLDCEMPITKEKNTKKQKGKKIRIKKIRKIFKKKKVDFIICNINHVKKYLKTFIKDSVYINKDMLYIYDIKDENLQEELTKKYKRYNVKIEIIKDENDIILKIDNKKSKTNVFKDFIYLIIDNFFCVIDIISDILLN